MIPLGAGIRCEVDHQSRRTAYVPIFSSRSRTCSERLRVIEADKETGYFVCNRETACSAERVDGKPACQHSCRSGACSRRRFGIVRGVSDHDRLRADKAQFSQSQPYKARVRFAMFDIITTRHYLDKFIDVQERQVVLQFGAFAIRREGDPAAAARKRLEHLADNRQKL